MSTVTDPNHPGLKSFVTVKAESDFPIQNLPLGVFTAAGRQGPRIGVAIGEDVLDLAAVEQAGLLRISNEPVFNCGALNRFAALGRGKWRETRSRISQLLRHDNPELRDHIALRRDALLPQAAVTMHLPFEIRAFTDFYSSEHHAANVGRLFRDKNNPLLPNWKHLPVAYNGRASTVVVSGTPVRRPWGQVKPGDKPPVFLPSQKLDFELELGFFIGTGNAHGRPIRVAEAEDHIFGVALVNDWSARDHQSWEYVPLGPFLSKSFATTVSPWVVSLDALQPFAVDVPAQDPEPLPYLRGQGLHNYDIRLSVDLRPGDGAAAKRICTTSYREIYWTMSQQLAHHTVNGCAMNTGDLLASGTISGPERSAWGSLLELTFNGAEPVDVNGLQRSFLADGDEIVMHGYCQGQGYRVGFGTAAGKILPAAEV